MSSESKEYKEAESAKSFYSNGVKYCMEGNLSKLSRLIEDYEDEHPHNNRQTILENFHSEGKTLVHIAAASGHKKILDYFLENVESRQRLLNLRDDRGFTPLMNATISESSDMMRNMIKLGADVNSRNNSGSAAIHFAAADGSIERLSILYEANSDLDYVSLAGTPLHWAAGKNRIDAIR